MNWENEPFWASGATLYTTPTGLEGHRLRFLIAEKQCPIQIQITRGTTTPLLAEVNPENKYPFLTDKMLALWCIDSIEQYIDERFPAPTYLPADPKIRAQLRQITNNFRQWYLIEKQPWIQNAVKQLAGLLGSDPWIAGREMTTADIALIPWLWRLGTKKVLLPRNVALYMARAFSREAFIASLSPEEMGLGQTG